jgi:cytochrome P450
MWHLVARHPVVENRLVAELDAVVGGRVPNWSDLPSLRYARSVVRESLRLYPTSWLMLRRALADDTCGGYRIPGGSFVVLCPFLTHRHPDFWPQAERFDPSRFQDGGVSRHRFAYFPFGGGPRKCIGATFAEREMTLVLASFAQRFRLASLPDHHTEPAPAVSLPPREGLPMRLAPRTSSARQSEG